IQQIRALVIFQMVHEVIKCLKVSVVSLFFEVSHDLLAFAIFLDRKTDQCNGLHNLYICGVPH
ncbi:hypothetical protein B4907_20600, partial [Yersinia kristensenii]